MKVTHTHRGFEIIEFDTYSGVEGGARPERLVQQSSAVGDYYDSFEKPGSSFLWVGELHHLNREEVADLIGYLQNWLDTGELSGESK